jgi:hypothetical protein
VRRFWTCPLEDGSLDDDQINEISGVNPCVPLSLWAYARIEYESDDDFVNRQSFCRSRNLIGYGASVRDRCNFARVFQDTRVARELALLAAPLIFHFVHQPMQRAGYISGNR